MPVSDSMVCHGFDKLLDRFVHSEPEINNIIIINNNNNNAQFSCSSVYFGPTEQTRLEIV